MQAQRALDETKVDDLAKLDHVVPISKIVQTRYSGGSLVSAIQPGTLVAANSHKFDKISNHYLL